MAQDSNTIDSDCLDCIAKVEKEKVNFPANSTGCFKSKFESGEFCGSYAISETYWKECSSPLVDSATTRKTEEEWKDCALDYECARQCVSQFTAKHVDSCRTSGGEKRRDTLLCVDYGSIHSGRKHGCTERDNFRKELSVDASVHYYVEDMVNMCKIKDHPKIVKSSAQITAILAGVLVPLLIITIITLGILFWRIKRKKKQKRGSYRMDLLHKGDGVIADCWQKFEPIRERFKIPIECLEMFEEIGRGHFGQIRRGRICTYPMANDGKIVAVKLLKNSNQLTTADLEAFLGEAVIMEKFNHPNVLRLIGLVWEKDELPVVVIPFMGNGDLLHLIQKSEMKFNEADLLNFTAQIAQGLEYLETESFVHRDIALRNCLVSDYFVVKVSDFGLSRDTYEKNYYVTTVKDKQLPWKWLAIESMKHGRFSHKSDVWSFGVLMWELFTKGSTPYPAITSLAMLEECLEAGYRLSKPPGCPHFIHEMMGKCWQTEPDERPSFTVLSTILADIMATRESEISYDYTAEARTENHDNLVLPTDIAPGIPSRKHSTETYIEPLADNPEPAYVDYHRQITGSSSTTQDESTSLNIQNHRSDSIIYDQAEPVDNTMQLTVSVINEEPV